MEQEKTESSETVTPPDLTGLESNLSDLVEVLETERKDAELLAEEETQKALEAEKKLKEEQLLLEEEAKLQLQNVEKEQELLQSLVTGVDEILVANERYHTENQELLIDQHKDVVEGFYFVGLSIIISFAVYMFWNQLSKW